MNAINELKEQFNNLQLIRVFEIEVLNNETGEQDWVLFNISLRKNTLVAQHIGLSAKEDRSNKIAFKKVALDKYFSLDEHLQTLHEECINGIIDGDLFELAD